MMGADVMGADRHAVHDATDLLVTELGADAAETELQRRFSASKGAELDRVKAALSHVRRQAGENQ